MTLFDLADVYAVIVFIVRGCLQWWSYFHCYTYLGCRIIFWWWKLSWLLSLTWVDVNIMTLPRFNVWILMVFIIVVLSYMFWLSHLSQFWLLSWLLVADTTAINIMDFLLFITVMGGISVMDVIYLLKVVCVYKLNCYILPVMVVMGAEAVVVITAVVDNKPGTVFI